MDGLEAMKIAIMDITEGEMDWGERDHPGPVDDIYIACRCYRLNEKMRQTSDVAQPHSAELRENLVHLIW